MPQSPDKFSKKMERIIINLKYNRFLLRDLHTGTVHATVVKRSAEKENVDKISKCIEEVRNRLRGLWKELRKYYKN